METLKHVACRAETAQRLRRLSTESPRQWGKMTANQMVCHLTNSYQMATGERPAKDRSSLWTRTGLKWRFLYAPVPWPKGVPTSPRNDPQRDGTKPTDFAQDLERLIQRFDAFVAAAQAGQCSRHPLFGALSPKQWLRWGYLHADHHLRQFGN